MIELISFKIWLVGARTRCKKRHSRAFPHIYRQIRMIKRTRTVLRTIVGVTAALMLQSVGTSAAENSQKKSEEPTGKLPVEKGTPEAPVNAPAIEGVYYRGNGLSYNLELTLRPGGEYTAKWDSCLYKAGKVSGTWKLSDKRIVFAPAMEGEMLRGRLEALDVLKFKGEWILVPIIDVTDVADAADAGRRFYDTLYEREGVTPLSCFQRIELAGDWHFENGAMGEFQELKVHRQRTFTWVIRDEPLNARDTYEGKWQIRDGALHLEVVTGQNESGESRMTRHRSYAFSISPDRESLVLQNADFRMKRVKPKAGR
jgi:hypothetical protein